MGRKQLKLTLAAGSEDDSAARHDDGSRHTRRTHPWQGFGGASQNSDAWGHADESPGGDQDVAPHRASITFVCRFYGESGFKNDIQSTEDQAERALQEFDHVRDLLNYGPGPPDPPRITPYGVE